MRIEQMSDGAARHAALKAAFKTELKRLVEFGLSLEQATAHVYGQIRFLHEARVRERRAAMRIVGGTDGRNGRENPLPHGRRAIEATAKR